MTRKPTKDSAATATGAELPGLALLHAELAALAIMLPGLLPGLPSPVPLTEAEVEAGFDNMPV